MQPTPNSRGRGARLPKTFAREALIFLYSESAFPYRLRVWRAVEHIGQVFLSVRNQLKHDGLSHFDVGSSIHAKSSGSNTGSSGTRSERGISEAVADADREAGSVLSDFRRRD